MIEPEAQRSFALEIVRRLREAGFEAYWAGGCVRDQLLGRVPKDYDVAASARPEQVQQLFGQRRTLAIGAAFGVIGVRGPRHAGMIEVATFRQDAAYSDGRHPDHVTFSSAREDAARRDFTINGLFYDPLAEKVIDFVGGQKDLLEKHVIRAIGSPPQRFGEDKLRMLRAVRFSAALGFQLEAETRDAIRCMADQIKAMSAERIAMEMRRLLVEPGRTVGVRLLLETGLAAAVLPEIVPVDDAARRRLDNALDIIERLRQPGFPLALAALVHEMVDAQAAGQIGLRWKLSKKELERVVWLVEHHAALCGARTERHSVLQPLLISEGIGDLLALHELAAAGPDEAAFCRSLLAQPREVLDPPPLLSGDDLLAHGVPAGPQFRPLLQQIRDAQLDGEIHTPEEALAMVDRGQASRRREPPGG